MGYQEVPIEASGGSSAYTPANSTLWAVTPTTFAEALDAVRREIGWKKRLTTTVTHPNDGSKLEIVSFAMEANKRYQIDATVFLTSDGQGVFRIWPTYPTNCDKTYTGFSDIGPNNSFQEFEVDNGAAQVGQYVMPNTGGFSSLKFQVDVHTGDDAGDFTIRMSSHAGTYGDIRAGSHFAMKEILV